jgi:hypothetical protein
MTAATTGAGKSGRRDASAIGGSPSTRAPTSKTVCPGKGIVFEKSSNATTPRAHTSLRASTDREDLICSGDMYDGEPNASDVAVIAVAWATSFAMPKSRIFAQGSPDRRRTMNTFSGFKSRCTSPAAWAWARPSQT